MLALCEEVETEPNIDKNKRAHITESTMEWSSKHII